MKQVSLAKALCSALLLTMTTTGIYARHLTPEEALSRTQNSNGAKKIAGTSGFNLIHSEEADGEAMVYVFNKGNDGFIVASADDRMPALLGYSDAGAFDPENASPSLKWWLSQYAEEGAFANTILSAATSDNASTRAESSDRQAIPHLLSTQWGQEYPFNIDCPQIGNRKTVTGCVATAMAQVIKYHNYPASGVDTHSYEWNNATLTFDYSGTFSYDLMADSYGTPQSAEANDAVAQLMFACGVGVDMNYGFEESGASDIYISYVLRHYFNYDNGVKYLKRDFFTADQWEDLIYAELQQARPVIYGGQAPKGGHQFVCDGYDGNGYFHINWGWNGYGDGHFLLSALNPEYQGVGGFEGGYNSDQAAICGIQPPVANSKVWYPLYASGNLEVTELTSSTVNINFSPGAIWNYSQQPATVEFILSAVGEDGTEYLSEPRQVLYEGDDAPTSLYHFEGANGGSVFGRSNFYLNMPGNLPSGEYKCTIMIKTPEGNVQKVYIPATAISYFNLSVSANGHLSYTPGVPEETAKIRVVRFEPVSDVVKDVASQFYITIENYGDIDYSGTIEYRIFKDGNQVNDIAYGLNFPSLQSGASATYILTQAYPFDSGTYDFIFYDQYGEEISSPFSITIGDSGVDSIIGDAEEIDVYSASGVLIKGKAGKEFIDSLPKGLYVIKANGTSSTILK